MKKKMGLGFLLSLALVISACSSSQNSVQTIYTSGSLAYEYDTFSEIEENSDLIAEVEVEGVDHVEIETESTFYKVIVKDLLMENEDLKQGDSILVKSMGIELEGEKTGEVKVIREDDPLMYPGERYLLFLKKHDSLENAYWLPGGYQSRFYIENEQVHSLDQDTTKEIFTVNEDLEIFKEKIISEVKTID